MRADTVDSKSSTEGGTTGFGGIIECHQKRIYSLVYRMVGNHADADCLTQETFLKAYRKIGRFRGEAKVGTWLWRIACNTCMDFLKGRQREEVTIGEVEEGLAVTRNGSAKAAETAEKRAMVRQALDRLEPEDRAVITLTVMEGVSHREAGEILGIPAGTVSWRVAETKKVLARKLSRYIQEEEK